jgi:hypothetical protein
VASNATGTSYGQVESFTTNAGAPVNTYPPQISGSVVIG